MRHRMLAVSAVLGILLLAGCRTSVVPGSAYAGASANARSSMAPSAASPSSGASASAGASASSGASASASPAVLTVRKTPAGYVLANATGYTIYWFARDHRGSPRPTCTGRCLLVWFPVTGHPVAAKGVRLHAVLGTITRPDGVVQATYDGYPLYTFGSDSAPGQAHGNGAGGVWHVVPERAPAS